jgi:hypothetical protein
VFINRKLGKLGSSLRFAFGLSQLRISYDSTGRLSSVTGTSFGGVTTYASNGAQSVTWDHREPSGASVRGTDVAAQGAGEVGELDPLGANAGLFKPITWSAPRSTGDLVPFGGLPDMGTSGGGVRAGGSVWALRL